MDNENYLLQLTDTLTDRKCVLRVDKNDSSLPLEQLLEKYLKNAPLERLLEQGRITHHSADGLAALQDLVYMSSDSGQLGDLFAGVLFRQAQRNIDLGSTPVLQQEIVENTPVSAISLSIDRTNAGYDRNWVGFNKRRWMRNHRMYSDFVTSTLERQCGPAQAEATLLLTSKEHKLRFVQGLARRIWESDFESYSRYTGLKLAHKSGDETVRNIIEGAGGICAEKVQALKFITDHYGISSEYILAGVDARGPIPEANLREMLDTFDFSFSKRHMRYWQHTALLYHIEGTEVLVDATNGNIPLLFLTDGAAESMLRDEAKQPVSVRMVDSCEDFYYHRVAQDIPENLFFAMEGWIPYMDLVQVFENELGLYLSAGFYVTPIVFRSVREFDDFKREYIQICDRAGLEYTVSNEWTLDSPLGQEFIEQAPFAAERVLLSEEHLLKRYDEWDGGGHEGGLVIIRLGKPRE